MNPTRYWYHVSTSLTGKKLKLTPRKEGENRCYDEPKVARICAAPSVEHCLTAIPYYSSAVVSVYRTLRKVRAEKAREIIDAHITKEHWVTKKVNWIKMGVLDLSMFEAPEECASSCQDSAFVRRTLKKWKKRKLVKKYMDATK